MLQRFVDREAGLRGYSVQCRIEAIEEHVHGDDVGAADVAPL